MLEIEIDGKQLQVPDGSTVIEAASKVGAYVPHFCYHKKLSIAANCRMCLVQVEKAPKPLPACATPVTNGMKVWTHSEPAIKAQKGVMEFLLINHPLDCPICDQGGECQLQDLSVGYGGVSSRYQEEKRVVSNKDLGSLVSTDMTRCINCTRCVRFTTEIAGLMELGQAFRGEHAEIMPFVEKALESELSGNIIDLCPVGALTSKPFRFGARAWEMSRRKSVSPHDSLGSNLIVQIKNDKVKRVLPLENEAINECWLSDRDRFSYEAVNGPERLLKPMIKQGGVWQEATWEVALEYVVNGLKSVSKEHGPRSIGAWISPHSTLEEMYLVQRLMRGLESGNVDFRLRQSDFSADDKLEGAPWLGMSIADVSKLDRLLIVGSFFRKDHPLLAQRVRQAAKKGLKINALGAAFDDWRLPLANVCKVAPDEFKVVLARIAGRIASQTSQSISDELASFVSESGADNESSAIADSIASGRKIAIWLGNQAAQDVEAVQLQILIQEIARLSRASFGVIGEAANSVGGYIAGAIPHADLAGMNVQQMINGDLKACVLLGVEPEYDMADGVAARTALQNAETVIVLNAFKSKDALDYADVMLPVAPFTETAGTYVNAEGAIQSFYSVVKSTGDSRPAWKILRVLGSMAGIPGFEFERIEDVRDASLGPNHANVKLSNVLKGCVVTAKRKACSLQRVSDIPPYAADPIVRRSEPLQNTLDAVIPTARMSSKTLAEIGVGDGEKVRVKSKSGEVTIFAQVDSGVADGCVRLAGAHDATKLLGSLSAEILVERA